MQLDPVFFKDLARNNPLRTDHVKFGIYKKLGCRREAARRAASLKVVRYGSFKSFKVNEIGVNRKPDYASCKVNC